VSHNVNTFQEAKNELFNETIRPIHVSKLSSNN